MVKQNYEIGQVVGRCIYLGSDHLVGKRYSASFKCECGNIFIGDIITVKRERRNYCSDECVIKKALPSNKKPIHGQSKTPEYRAWKSTKERCCNVKSKAYYNYGGRGVSIDSEWVKDFMVFFNYMGLRPSKKHSLDRFPNQNGNYEPGNCRWATSKQQNRNRRDNVLVTYNGETKCLSEWAEELKVSITSLRRRIGNGCDIGSIFERPFNSKTRDIFYDGKVKSLKEWAKLFDINYNSLMTRLRKGWSLDMAFKEPIKTYKNAS